MDMIVIKVDVNTDIFHVSLFFTAKNTRDNANMQVNFFYDNKAPPTGGLSTNERGGDYLVPINSFAASKNDSAASIAFAASSCGTCNIIP